MRPSAETRFVRAIQALPNAAVPRIADEDEVDELPVAGAHRRMLHQTTSAPAAATSEQPEQRERAPALARAAPPTGTAVGASGSVAAVSAAAGGRGGASGSGAPSTTSKTTTVMLSSPPAPFAAVHERRARDCRLLLGAAGESQDLRVADHVVSPSEQSR